MLVAIEIAIQTYGSENSRVLSEPKEFGFHPPNPMDEILRLLVETLNLKLHIGGWPIDS